MTIIRKGQFCVAAQTRWSALINMTITARTSFEILKCTKSDREGVVVNAITVSGSPADWKYIYGIPDHQDQARALFAAGETVYDDIDALKAALSGDTK